MQATIASALIVDDAPFCEAFDDKLIPFIITFDDRYQGSEVIMTIITINDDPLRRNN